MLLGIAIYLIVAWNNIPDQIPGHFDASGQVTRWDSKISLIIVPIIAAVLFAGISILERFPQIWNTGVRVTEENKFRVYKILKGLITSIKFLIVAAFAAITVIQSLAQQLPIWFLPVFIAPILLTIVFHIIWLVRAR